MSPASTAASTRPAMLLMIDGLEAVTAGGTERQVLRFAKVLHGAGYRVVVYVLRGIPFADPKAYPFELIYGQIPSLASPGGVVRLMRLRSWMKRERFQMVQTFLREANVVGPILAWMAGVPVVLGHRRNTNHWMGLGYSWAQWFANRFATRLLANSERVKESVVRLEGVTAEKVEVFYNGIEVARFAPDPAARSRVRQQFGLKEQDLLIGAVATLRPIKGIPDFVRAAQQVAAADPRVNFMVVGDGPFREAFTQDIQTAGLTGRFHLAGGQEDVVPYLQAMDIAVSASLAEGFSNAILEFMARGLPIVATDVGGNREAFGEDGGILVPPAKPDELAAAISRLVSDPALRASLGAAAHARACTLFHSEKADRIYLEYVAEQLRRARA